MAIGFSDIVGFTKLGGELTPDELGRLASRLAEVAMAAAKPPVRVVNTLGDGVMVAAPDVEPLLDALLTIVERCGNGSGDFPAVRAGAATRWSASTRPIATGGRGDGTSSSRESGGPRISASTRVSTPG